MFPVCKYCGKWMQPRFVLRFRGCCNGDCMEKQHALDEEREKSLKQQYVNYLNFLKKKNSPLKRRIRELETELRLVRSRIEKPLIYKDWLSNRL